MHATGSQNVDDGQGILRDGDGPEAWNNRGAARFARGEVGASLYDFGRALELRPDYPEALNNRGIVRHRLGDAAGALADFDRAIKLNPRYPEALNNRAVTRMAVGDLAGALADYDRAVGIRPDFADAYHGRAAALHAWGDLDGALADYDRVLALVPTESAAPVHHLRAAVRVTQKRFAEAVAECTRALELDPLFCVAYISRGNARYHLRDLGGLADYRTAFQLDPHAAAADIVRVLTGSLTDVDEVLDNCRKHLRLNPDDAVALSRRALTLLLLGREEESERDLAIIRQKHPEWQEHLSLLISYATRSRPAAAAHNGRPRG